MDTFVRIKDARIEYDDFGNDIGLIITLQDREGREYRNAGSLQPHGTSWGSADALRALAQWINNKEIELMGEGQNTKNSSK